MKKTFNVVISVEEKSFKNDKGETVAYKDIRMTFKGEEIRLNVKAEDKNLFNYLCK